MKTLSLKKLRTLQTKLPLPLWYTNDVHKFTVKLVRRDNKLQACKYLMDLSADMMTRDQGYGLQWAKCDVVDHIAESVNKAKVKIAMFDTIVALGNKIDEMQKTLNRLEKRLKNSQPSSTGIR